MEGAWDQDDGWWGVHFDSEGTAGLDRHKGKEAGKDGNECEAAARPSLRGDA